MSILSTPRHTEKLNGHYLSSSPQYLPIFQETLRRITKGSAFWDPRRS